MAAEEETTMAAAIMEVVATAVVSVVVEAAEVEAIAVAPGVTSTMVLTTMVVGLVAMVAFTLRDTMANSTPTFMKATLDRKLKRMEASPMLMDERPAGTQVAGGTDKQKESVHDPTVAGNVGLEANNVVLGVGDGAENNNMQIDGENPSQGATKKRK